MSDKKEIPNTMQGHYEWVGLVIDDCVAVHKTKIEIPFVDIEHEKKLAISQLDNCRNLANGFLELYRKEDGILELYDNIMGFILQAINQIDNKFVYSEI